VIGDRMSKQAATMAVDVIGATPSMSDDQAEAVVRELAELEVDL